jgi:hypothetical protein
MNRFTFWKIKMLNKKLDPYQHKMKEALKHRGEGGSKKGKKEMTKQ